MSQPTQPYKQVYIPALPISGAILAQSGTDADGALYPDKEFTITLNKEDFEDEEDYHSVWIILTKATRKKVTELLAAGKL